MDGTDSVTLAEAADRLGVHYQTVYRWVRQGSLPAVKVAGAYLVDVEHLDAFAAARQVPEAPPRRVRVRDWTAHVHRLEEALVVGDESASRDALDHLHDGGVSLLELCDLVIRPALVGIGERWMAGEVSVAEEHRASAICERQLGRLTPSPPGRPRGVCVVCSPPIDEHRLPGAMATTVLREDHWRVHHLGIGVPVPYVLALVEAEDADLVVVSVAWPRARAEAGEMAASLEGRHRRVMVGQPGDTLRELVSRARGDGETQGPGDVMVMPR